MPDLPADPRAATDYAWFSWRDRNLEDMSPREAFAVGFRRGAQWCAKTSGQMSPHIANFVEFMMWIMERPQDDIWDTWDEPVELAPALPATNGTGDETSPW